MIRFRLRQADPLTLDVLNRDHRLERRLVGPRPAPRGENHRIELDTQAPVVLEAKPSRTVFSPDGDGQFDSLRIQGRYRLVVTEHGHSDRAVVVVRARG